MRSDPEPMPGANRGGGPAPSGHEEALDLFHRADITSHRHRTGEFMKVTVLGAGVIGVTTAFQLAKAIRSQ
jgi:hypothetical protein